MKKLIYLATPYSDPERTKRAKRFMTACELSAALFKYGYMVFSPIAHTHPLCDIGGLPHEFEHRKDLAQFMISISGVVLIVDMRGSENSEGIREQTIIAQELKKPVVYATEDEIIENKWAHRLEEKFLYNKMQGD